MKWGQFFQKLLKFALIFCSMLKNLGLLVQSLKDIVNLATGKQTANHNFDNLYSSTVTVTWHAPCASRASSWLTLTRDQGSLWGMTPNSNVSYGCASRRRQTITHLLTLYINCFILYQTYSHHVLTSLQPRWLSTQALLNPSPKWNTLLLWGFPPSWKKSLVRLMIRLKGPKWWSID